MTVTPGSTPPRGVGDRAFDDTGRGLGLGEKGGSENDEEERERTTGGRANA